MLSEQACIYLTHSVCTVWKWLYLRYWSHSRLYHHGSALKLRNIVAASLHNGYIATQRLVSWWIQWFRKYELKSEQEWRMVKISCAEAIQNGVVYFRRYNCFSVSVCSVGTWDKTRIAFIKNEHSNLLPKFIHAIFIFFIRFLRIGLRGVHQTQIWVAFHKVWGPLI